MNFSPGDTPQSAARTAEVGKKAAVSGLQRHRAPTKEGSSWGRSDPEVHRESTYPLSSSPWLTPELRMPGGEVLERLEGSGTSAPECASHQIRLVKKRRFPTEVPQASCHK